MAYSTYLKYARALIEVAVERDIEDRIEREMEAFQVLLADHELLRGTLETPALPFEPKRRIVEELASRLGLSETARNFVLVLLRNGRIAEFDQALAALREVLDERRRIVRGEVTSAQPLGDSTRTRLLEAVREMTGRGARLDFQQDEALIGGIKLKIGSTVFDGSIQTALETLKKELAG